MTLPGYEVFEEISRNDWQITYRGRRIKDSLPVLLKRPRRPAASALCAQLLEHEFEILSKLSIPGIARGLELLYADASCCLILEDTGGSPPLSVLNSRSLDLGLFFRFATQMSVALAELHRRDIIHRHINPGSILFNPETGEGQIMDVSLASRATDDVRAPVVLQLLGQSLTYISPEQTGRMNRTTDYRTDFYSLGVTFYEMLTGAPPFQSDDALELIHWHIARTPPPPAQINPDLPAPLSAIVMKLLSKTAEERYQSALGLKEDLDICERAWNACGTITPFALGGRDVADRFLMSQKLYGRDKEVEKLLSAFEGVCRGPSALMLVAGYSGIGKSSLINELYKPIARERGYFMTGKFDQIARIPYDALIQAFRGLIRQLLTEGEERLGLWRARLNESLGAGGGVVAEVIPEIEMILGKQPAPPALGPTEAQNRFRLVFQNLLRPLARKEHPLVLFLDDLQWADSATLNLLEPLLTTPEIQYLFVIGAYRDNEVDAVHPLTETLGELKANGAGLYHLSLGPLVPSDLTLLVRDTLHGRVEDVAPLAELVSQKTAGNPFFVNQFLQTLNRERLLEFDYDQNRWTFQIEEIAKAGMTDNVIDLMTRKIQRLSPTSQSALTLGACIGNQFDLTTLAIISQQSAQSVTENLKEALDEGLVISSARAEDRAAGDRFETEAIASPVYAFLHDRVQQAAYGLIPDDRKKPVHLQVGRLLLAGCGGEAPEDRLFEIANHLNVGQELVTDAYERVVLARLNLQAGRKAKASAAFQAALGYFEFGLRMLEEACWDSEYDLMLWLNLEAGECLSLCGYFEEAEDRFDLLLERAQTRVDKSRVYDLKIRQYENTSRYTDAIRIGHEGLALFGLTFPQLPGEKRAALDRELETINRLIDGRSIESLIDLPLMTDPEIKAVMGLLANLHTQCYLSGDKDLTLLNTAAMVRLSLTYGNTEESAHAYVLHAMNVGQVMGDYRSAYEFGKLALRLNERLYDAGLRAKILMNFAWAVSIWRKPFADSFAYLSESFRLGNESGFFADAGYAIFDECHFRLFAGGRLSALRQVCDKAVSYLKRAKIDRFADAPRVILQWGLALEGSTASPTSLTGSEFDEAEYLSVNEGQSLFEMFCFVAKTVLLYTFDEYEATHRMALEAERVIKDFTGTIWDEQRVFYHSLALAELHRDAGEQRQREIETELEAMNSRMRKWAECSPHNFAAPHLILSAEIARVRENINEAFALYEAAIEATADHECPRERALANELCAKFWRERGQTKIAAMFMTEARNAYNDWGARAKVEDLERKYPELLKRERTVTLSDRAQERETISLDLATITKAARAITIEIELDNLLRKIVEIAMENAGAERGIFLQDTGKQLVIEAEGAVGKQTTVRQSLPVEDSGKLSQAVVFYVGKTGESVVIGDAAADERFASDSYVRDQKPKSILCVPIVYQGRSSGILYLENNLSTEAFTSERIELMSILSATAAIALEKAFLYEEMKQEAVRRQEAEETLRSIVEGTAAVTGGEFFYLLVRHLASALKVRYAFVTKCRDEKKTRVRTLAFWAGDDFGENFEYDLAGTPCYKVIEGEACHYSHDLQRLFPEDVGLVEWNAQSFMGFPMTDATGEIIGHLAVLDDHPMDADPRNTSVLKIFAARAGAELERQQAEEELRQALAEVEQLKNRLHDENVYLQEEIRKEHNFEEMVGSSPALLEALRKVEMVAPTDSTVLIWGETGTGKELIARAIHNNSARRDRPLVKVNCGAISAGLVESELFGHVKGAFTGAHDRRVGRFELADGGTLFLDEVSELPVETQVKLLRVLQEQEFEPVGSSRSVRVDVRIIAATNRDLEEAVRAGRFRSDLFYRLNVFPLRVPPLRERLSDLPQLVMFFQDRFSKKFGKKIESVSQETMALLMGYPWPGNVRELQNMIERAVVLARGPVLTLDRDLLPSLALRDTLAAGGAAGKTSVASIAAPYPASSPPQSVATTSPPTLEEVERQHILSVLSQTRWIIEGPKGAARLLELHPNTLRSRMKKLGIQRSTHEIS